MLQVYGPRSIMLYMNGHKPQ
uniref:Uncharacterized protein n=1 Tax=Anguilla anguilla TaxID=7936 RepID=A0A0E9UMV7_ANGAN